MLTLTLAIPLQPVAAAFGLSSEIWPAERTHQALLQGDLRLLDIRSRSEWRKTGVGGGAWPVSMHEPRFGQKLFAAREIAAGQPVALICATGGRTGSVMRALRKSGYSGFIDVSEGMFGSAAGRGWVAKGLPVVPMEAALRGLPRPLI